MERKGKGKKHGSHKKKASPAVWIAVAVAVIITVLAVSGNLPFTEKGGSFTLKGGETRPVLDPSMFSGRARSAYEAAKKYSAIMDQVYCYCYCDEEPLNHVSLKSCFTEKHGAG